MSQTVVLVHGLGRTQRSMSRLAKGLEDQGFHVVKWPYPSRRHDLTAHFKAFRAWLSAQTFDGAVHLVGHSLGGIIIRGALAQDPPVTVGRIVMIAPPNKGAGVVTNFGHWPFSRLLFGKPLEDLAEGSKALRDLDVPSAEIGIIAGDQPFHLFNPVSWVNFFNRTGHVHDGTVELANTQLDQARDSIVISAHHTFICDHPDVILQTGKFLRDGTFAH